MARPSAQLRATVQRATVPLLIALSIAVIVIGKADQSVFSSLRTTLSDDAAPVLDILSRPLGLAAAAVDNVRGLVMLYQDNLRLQRDNTRLQQWQQVAQKLSEDNRQLRALLKVVPDGAVSYATARVIAGAGGGFVRSVLVDAGAEAGLARGQAAIAGDGLIGRLTDVGNRAARVLLITDLNSRIPVSIGGAHVRAVLAGDNSERPRLLYLGGSETLRIGDRVVTSGEGGVFPPDLPVGLVASIGLDGPRVEPFVELSQLGYVLAVDYGLANNLPQPAPVVVRHRGRNPPPVADEASVR